MRRSLALLLFLALWPTLSQAQITIDSPVSTGSTTVSDPGGTPVTLFSHTVGSGSNRLLVVSVTVVRSGATTCQVSGLTYGGVSLTGTNGVFWSTNNSNQLVAYYLVAPVSGAANVDVTVDVSGASICTVVVGGISFANVHQSAPIAQLGSTLVNTLTATATSLAVSYDTSDVGCGLLLGIAMFGSSALVGAAEANQMTTQWNTNDASTVYNIGATQIPTQPAGTTEWRFSPGLTSAAVTYMIQQVAVNSGK